MLYRNLKLYILILLIAGSAFASGWFLGSKGYAVEVKDNRPEVILSHKEPPDPGTIKIDFSAFWKAWDLLNEKYVDQPLDQQKLLYGALQGLAAAIGDPYTTYLPPKENKEVDDNLNGRFEGIGAELGMREGQLTIIAPLEGSPAESVGIKPADKILKVDGEETLEMTLAEAVQKIRGPAGTEVVLNLRRGDADPFDVPIKRQQITIKSISWQDKGDGVIYIRASRFGESTGTDWDKVINEILASNTPPPTSVILDVRSNPGGYLQASVHLASEFVNSGIIVAEQFGDGTRHELKPNHRGRLLNIPVVVLINEGSASASEILAGALRDLKGAKLIGQQSFGKGTVQDAVEFGDTSSLHVTIARWLTPNGENIDGVGLPVDFEVKLDEDKFKEGIDTQLEKAIEIAKTL